jgi:hypothetical protein
MENVEFEPSHDSATAVGNFVEIFLLPYYGEIIFYRIYESALLSERFN